MREKSRWQGCFENVAIFAIAIPAGVIALLMAIYVHENAYQWEAPVVFISLGLGILPALWYWHQRRHGWVVSIIAAVFLAISFGTALSHGWGVQALALVIVATVVIVVASSANFARAKRRLEAAMRASIEERAGDPLFRRDVLFRDDGQRIMVYPRRRRLLLMCVGQVAFLVGIASVFAFVRTDDPRVWILWIGSGLLACILIPVFLATLHRTLIRKPALVVGPDGILDNGSLPGSGVGLIRWDEILAVYPITRTSGWLKQHFLDIMVADLPIIRRRLPLLKRVALRTTYSRMSQVLIMQSMLETPVGDLTQQIDQYVTDHAPPGWREGAQVDEASTLDEQ